VLATEDGWTSEDGDNEAPWVHPDGRSQNEKPDGLKPFGVIDIANAISNMGALSSANFLGNKIPMEQAQELVQIMQSKEKLTTLCGLSGKEAALDFSNQGLGAGDAVLIANDIRDMGAMSSLNLANNNMGAGWQLVAEDGWQYDEEDGEYSKVVTQEQEPLKEMIEAYVDGWEYDEEDQEYWKNVNQEQEPPKEMVEVYVDGWEYDEDDGDYWREDEDGQLWTCTEEPEKQEKEQYTDGWEYVEEERMYQKTVTQKGEPTKEGREQYVDGWEYNKDSAVYMRMVVRTEKPMTSGALHGIFMLAMRMESMKIFCEIPFKDKTLTELDLSGKKLGTEGARVVAEYLDGNRALTLLNLSSNDLGVEGTKIVAEATKVTPFSCPPKFSLNCYCLPISTGQ
jgi:hypothetical protein